MSVKLDEVFGVSATPVLSYVQRTPVDDSFTAALRGDKQLVVYGSSKQGKTALVQRYLPYAEHIVVRLTPKTEVEDVYRSILRQTDVQILETTTDSRSREIGGTAKAGFKALIPFIGGADMSAEVASKAGSEAGKTYKEISFNLSLPQDISELLKETRSRKTIILGNFSLFE